MSLRRRATSWVFLALVVAIAGAVALGCVSAARRTASAHARYLAATNAADVLYPSDPQCDDHPCTADDFKSIGGVAAVSKRTYAIGVLEQPDGSLDPTGRDNAFFGLDRDESWVVDRPLLDAGRLPDVASTDEAFVDSTYAAQHHLAVDDEFSLRAFTEDEGPALQAEIGGGPKAGRSVHLRVTGIGRMGADLGTSGVVLLPERVASQFLSNGATVGVKLERGAAGIAEFVQHVDQRYGLVAEGTSQASHATAQRTMRPYVVALAVYAGIAAVLGLVLVGQGAARAARADAEESELLLAIGLTRRQSRARIAVGVAVAAAAGTIVAILVALAASPSSPVGPVGAFEPDPGVNADGIVLAAGGIAWITLTSAAGFTGIVLAERVRRHRVANEARVTRLLPITAATAVRFARPQPSGASPGSARPAIAGVATAALVLTAVLTFAAGLHRLVDTPRLYGWTFDGSMFLGYRSTDEQKAAAATAVAPELMSDPAVLGVTEMAGTDLTIGNLTVTATGTSGAGGAFTLTGGHPPAAPDEIVLGPRTASNVADGGIGSRITVVGPDGSSSAEYTVVGRAVFPDSPGEGVWMTLEGLRVVAPDVPVSQFGVRFAPQSSEADRVAVAERAMDQLRQQGLLDVSIDLPTPPSDTDGLVGIDTLPLALGVALGLATVVTLTHTLLTSLHGRRRDLATLRACGYTARQVWATVMTHAAVVTVAGLVIGLPLGLVLGRWAWSAWADGIGVVDTAVTPWAQLTLVALGALGAAALIAIGPARHASRVRVADALRAE
jgi:hypothetical protein